MLHRRLLDTGFPPLGLDEALNDTVPIDDTFWILLNDTQSSNRMRHQMSLCQNNPPLIAYPKKFSRDQSILVLELQKWQLIT